MRNVILLLVLLSLPAFCAPKEWEVKPPAHLQTQLEINSWVQGEFEKADAELNKVWNELLPKLSKKEKERLVDAQLHWIKFRDAQAESAALGYEGGSIAPYIHAESKVVSTRMRTTQLRIRLDELIRLGN